MEHSEFSMEQDDTAMVDDILAELNKETDGKQVNMNVLQQPPQMPPSHPSVNPLPEPIGQTLVHPDASVLNENPIVQEKPKVEENATSSLLSNILNKIKKPAGLILLIFVVFNPLTRKLLNRYIPVVFRSTSVLHQNLSILILSVIVGLSFIFVNKLL